MNNLLQRLVDIQINKLGISKREAGRQTGTSYTTVDRILRGEPIDIETLIKMCAWLRVSPSNVLDAYLPGDRALPERVAALVERKPELKEIFDEVMDQFLNHDIDETTFNDIILYANYRLEAYGYDGKCRSRVSEMEEYNHSTQTN